MNNRRAYRLVLVSMAAALLGPNTCGQPPAHADVTAYLIGVTVRPGYTFPNGDAVGYGYGVCDKVSQGRAYPQVMDDVRADFNTADDYQASYLINQAVNELCPALIWQLRNSAANYRSPSGSIP